MEARYEIARFDEIPGTPCPCGEAKRAFAESGNVASIHVVEIKKDSRVHFHKKMTEIYFILEGEGYLELDGEKKLYMYIEILGISLFLGIIQY